MKQRDLIKKLKEVGYREIRHEGDHIIFSKDGYPNIVVPHHREINEKLARGLLRQAGL